MATTTQPRTRVGTAWRIALVLVGTGAIWTLMVWVGASVFGGEVTRASRIVNALLIFCLAVPMVVVARRFLDQRPWAGLDLQGRASGWRHFLIGVASFLLPSAIGLSVALLAGWLQITSVVPPIELILAIGFTVLTVLLLEAIPEELIFRGYIYRNLSARMAPIMAVLVQAVLFAIFGTALWVLTAGWGILGERGALFLAIGVVLGILRVNSGSLWNPIGFHLAFQAVAQTLLGHPGIEVSNPGAVTMAGIIPAFVLGGTLTLALTRRRPNWLTPEPDERPTSGRG
ncbi:type II CAAX endopeptidase family protein [Microbacterium sp. zg-YB36]|uniref:CPBP family intramembrane glutamic endopeptidase n=1 Tax=Microbacterium sp. zg-YB36 TaxID=2969407 RepID=UPI00214B58F9|nr:type II CAAX endopeptidase family protein [Microbacterium sp. zg-YB36]MDL5350336.1 type II CAAX endopeptidase family protein [Microbacterium sp. zg-YB36]